MWPGKMRQIHVAAAAEGLLTRITAAQHAAMWYGPLKK